MQLFEIPTDPSAQQARLCELVPLDNSEAQKKYNSAMTAFIGRTATPDQTAIIAETEMLKESLGRLQDRIPAEA